MNLAVSLPRLLSSRLNGLLAEVADGSALSSSGDGEVEVAGFLARGLTAFRFVEAEVEVGAEAPDGEGESVSESTAAGVEDLRLRCLVADCGDWERSCSLSVSESSVDWTSRVEAEMS